MNVKTAGLRILLTNNTLGPRAGSEMYVRDLAVALMLPHPRIRSDYRHRNNRQFLHVQHPRAPLRHLVAEPRRNDRDLDLVPHPLIQNRAENNVRVLMRLHPPISTSASETVRMFPLRHVLALL